jgi:catechol 2,3-dioxygenase-like lactoylglutathione lyase family enzyme
MMLTDFSIDDIDHIEMFVADRLKTTKWYESVFGLRPLQELDMWSKTGPLFIGNKERTVTLALMNGTRENNGSINRMAFRTTGEKFVDFLNRINDMELFFLKDKVTKDNVVDHDISFSIYFDDPDGNKLELTSYDYDFVKLNI